MTDSTADRLAFVGFDDSSRHALQAFLPLLDTHLPAILDKFYNHVQKHPPLAAMFATPARMDHAKMHQGLHWKALFSGRFDEPYIQSVQRIGKTHSRIGLTPPWYIGAYSFVLAELNGVAIRHFTPNARAATEQAQTLTATLNAIQKAVMIDVDLVISVYLDENKAEYDRRIAQLAESFESQVKGVVESVSLSAQDNSSRARTISRTTENTSQMMTAVSASMEQASVNVQLVSAATEQLSCAIAEITRQMNESARVAGLANESAMQSEKVASSLSSAVQNISDVLTMIGKIASQTNLLALNATIEAARAGEAGRGFSVVASEVKTLAKQTADATDGIRGIIGGMQTATDQTVGTINTLIASIGNLHRISDSVAAAVEEQNAATREISANIHQLANGVTEVSESASRVQLDIAGTTTVTGELLGSSDGLERQAESLTQKVDTFLSDLRAA